MLGCFGESDRVLLVAAHVEENHDVPPREIEQRVGSPLRGVRDQARARPQLVEMGVQHLRAGLRETPSAGVDRPPTVRQQLDHGIELAPRQVGECRLDTVDEGIARDVEEMIAALLRRASAVEAKRRVDACGDIVFERALKVGVAGEADLVCEAQDRRPTHARTRGEPRHGVETRHQVAGEERSRHAPLRPGQFGRPLMDDVSKGRAGIGHGSSGRCVTIVGLIETCRALVKVPK